MVDIERFDDLEEMFEKHKAKEPAWFSRMMLKFWEKGGKINEEKNLRDWDGTVSIAKWCREELKRK